MLLGTYKLKLDAKQRLTLPAIFRKELDGQVCIVPIDGVLYGYSPESYQAWLASYFERDGQAFNPRKRRDATLRKYFASHTTLVEIDSAGRVALGKTGESGADVLSRLGREVTVIGDVDHFEVWQPEAWEAKQESAAAVIGSLMFDDDDE